MLKLREWFAKLLGRGEQRSVLPSPSGKPPVHERPATVLAANSSAPAQTRFIEPLASEPATSAAETRQAALAESEVSQEWNEGDVFLDLYEVRGVLGEGGMGKVFKVHHKGWNVELAVKSPRPEALGRAGGAESFARECENWVNLGLHPHIVSCYYVRTLGGIPRVFAEFVEGGSLSDWIRSRKLYEGGPAKSLERILDVAIQFAWGLHYAHEQGLVHQDVKPANVMMTPDGTAKATDFGLAQARAYAGQSGARGSPGHSVLVPGRGLMTPEYCSPEQARGEPLSRKTDVWSWGLSVLEMFSGERFWRAGQAAPEVLQGYREAGTGDASLPRMPDALARLVSDCFADASARPQSMKEIASSLRDLYRDVTGQPHKRREPKATVSADSLNNRAVSYLDLGKAQEAEQSWEEALQIEPHHIESTYNRGLILWRAARLDDAALLTQLDETQKSHRGDWKPAYLTALIHLERGDCDAALKILEPIQGARASEPEIQTALAIARVRQPDSGKLLRTFEGHEHWVSVVCLGQDGRVAISGSEDRTLKLWDVATGQCVRTLPVSILIDGKSRPVPVASVCLSSDGRIALSGERTRTLTLWDVAGGRRLRTFQGRFGTFKGYFRGHRARVNSVCLSPDVRFALSGSDDGTLKQWDVASGKCLRTLKGHKGRVKSISLSHDGRIVASGSEDGTLKVWDVASGQCLRTLKGYKGVRSVCVSHDGRMVLSNEVDDFKLWDVADGSCVRTFEGHHERVDSVCLSRDGRFALSGSQDGTVKLWDATTGRGVRTFPKGHKGQVTSVSLSHDGRLALSGSNDKTLKLWQTRAGESYVAPMMLCLARKSETVLSAESKYEDALANARIALARGNAVACATHVRTARSSEGFGRGKAAIETWFSLYTCLPKKAFSGGWEDRTFNMLATSDTTICLSPDGRHALSGDSGWGFQLWDVAGGRRLRDFEGHEQSVRSICLSDDGRIALSGSADKTLKLWDVATGRCLRTFNDHKEDVYSVCMSQDGHWALSGSRDKTLKLWEVATGRCVRTLAGHGDRVKSVHLSKDARVALSASDDDTFKLWDVATGRCLRTLKQRGTRLHSVYAGEDSRMVLLASEGGTLELRDVGSDRSRYFSGGGHGYVSSACLSEDKRFALSGGEDKTVRLWDVVTGRCLRVFEGHQGWVQAVCLTRDGCFALSRSFEGFKRWALDWELEDREVADWDEAIRPYLESFLACHMPYASTLTQNRRPTNDEIALALTRSGTPEWTEEDFQGLLHALGCSGYGYVRPEGVRAELERMGRDWKGPPPLPGLA
jgi:WD40 repeat protein/serine/threonine protein kinase